MGPIGILCIGRTLEFGRYSGLGAAIADAVYGSLAAFGLTFVCTFLLARQVWFKSVERAFPFYLGRKTFFREPVALESSRVSHSSVLRDFVSTVFLTIANPMTTLFFVVIFGKIGLSTAQGNYQEVSFLIGGVFLGSALWWLMVSEGVTLFRKKMNQRKMKKINQPAGVLLIGFVVLILCSLMQKGGKLL